MGRNSTEPDAAPTIDLVSLLKSANADTLAALDEQIGQLAAQRADLDQQLGALTAIRRSIDWRVNGKPKRKNRRRDEAAETDTDDAADEEVEDDDQDDDAEVEDEPDDPLEARIVALLKKQGALPSRVIANKIGESPGVVSRLLDSSDRFVTNGTMYQLRSS